MTKSVRKIAIVGGGIAGLCAAVMARKCGYEVEVFEQHDSAGGLATSWRRGDYTFETCLHWLLGSNPKSAMYSQWNEVFDIGKLKFLYPEEFVRLENGHGETLSVYPNAERMEAEFLTKAPQDEAEIRRFTGAVRGFTNFAIPDPTEPWPRYCLAMLRTVPYLPLLRYWGGITVEAYGKRFKSPLLRQFFGEGELSALALVLSLAWMGQREAGYPIGGSQAVIRLIVENLHALGVRLRLGAKVERILTENDSAAGVELAGGEKVTADWVISAADGHATIYELLGGKYTDSIVEKTFDTLKPFSSYLQVSLGTAKDLSQQPGFVTRILDTPLSIDPGTDLSQVPFRIFHYDPTFAPPGKTAITCFLPTYNFEYWVKLRQSDPVRYTAEKQRLAEAVIACLEGRITGIRHAIEVIDVSTPATVIRITGNWKGSYEGWLMTPTTGFKPLRGTLPGLRHFLMIGQWVHPGGGLPSGLMTARSAIQAVCRQDRIPFTVS